MSLIDDLHAEMLALYANARDAIGYRGTRYRQAVIRKGGLATAQRMLKPRTSAQRAGLDRLIEAGRPELSLEYLVLQPRFAELFTAAELRTARERLDEFTVKAAEARKVRDNIYPDELEPGRTYNDGAKRQVRVNAYERDPRARKACLAHHGTVCAVCAIDFEKRYGPVGKGFIHVHHVRPLAAQGKAEVVDPRTDLVPVCPNCHAMLHRGDTLRTVAELQTLLRPVG